MCVCMCVCVCFCVCVCLQMMVGWISDVGRKKGSIVGLYRRTNVVQTQGNGGVN